MRRAFRKYLISTGVLACATIHGSVAPEALAQAPGPAAGNLYYYPAPGAASRPSGYTYEPAPTPSLPNPGYYYYPALANAGQPAGYYYYPGPGYVAPPQGRYYYYQAPVSSPGYTPPSPTYAAPPPAYATPAPTPAASPAMRRGFFGPRPYTSPSPGSGDDYSYKS